MALLDYGKRNIRKNLFNARYIYRFFSVSGINIIYALALSSLILIGLSLYFISITWTYHEKNPISNLISASQLLVYSITAIFSLLSPILTFILIRITRKESKKSEARSIQALEQGQFENKLKLIDNLFQLVINMTGIRVGDSTITEKIDNDIDTIAMEIAAYKISRDSVDREIAIKAIFTDYQYYEKVITIRSEIYKICGNDKSLKMYASLKYQTLFMYILDGYILQLSIALDVLGDFRRKDQIMRIVLLYYEANFTKE